MCIANTKSTSGLNMLRKLPCDLSEKVLKIVLGDSVRVNHKELMFDLDRYHNEKQEEFWVMKELARFDQEGADVPMTFSQEMAFEEHLWELENLMDDDGVWEEMDDY